ncbi:MAG TPA: MFS transporter [Opitutaceae bacterium]|nr:MFS transporter [Opitutaceae bacterium]
MKSPWLKRALPWALYDWANSAFATTVMAAFVPIFNKDFWSDGAPDTVSTFRLSVASSTAAVIVALLAPMLGAIADRGGAKKRFLAFFAGLGVLATSGLSYAGQGQWALALTLYVIAWIGFAGANVFYDSLIVNIAERDKFDVVSALGFSLGYVGGGLLLAVNVLMVQQPALFGLANAGQAVRISFLMVGVWWALFSLPLLFKVPEIRPPKPPGGALAAIRAGFSQLIETFREIRRLRVVAVFLLAYWLYIDGVDTVIQMAVDYGRALKLDTGSLISALLITQFVGFPAALIFGKLGEKFGAKRGILAGLVVYIAVCIGGYRMQHVGEFYVLAVVIGLVQGGVQALSRSYYARLIPADKSAEFFGFYNMLGKFAAILGPAIMGSVALWTGNPRFGILAIIPLFVLGGALLLRVKPAAAATA